MPENLCKVCGGDHTTGFCTTSEGKEIHESVEPDRLDTFDPEYFRELEGEDGWIALGQEFCSNVRYFTVLDAQGTKLGIVGVYDTDDEKNVTHTVIDPKYRGKGLAGKVKLRLMNELHLPFITMTVDLDNVASLHAVEKMSGVQRTSDPTYEEAYHKVRFEFRPPPVDES
ncbi:MAG: GNAT family N-acetyltransferase [Candidatus Uhrbacteria bacterium]|nr:GNAT family N-acetyltransferase [Candidatus Uhrbacteria bacterium]